MFLIENISILSTIVAAFALILSQLPPIKDWPKKISINTTLSKRMFIDNAIGIIAYTLPLEIRNNGNREITISKIELKVKSTKKTNTYTAEGYYLLHDNNIPNRLIPITNITLKKDEIWNNSLFLSPPFSPLDEKQINKIRLSVHSSVSLQYQGFNNMIEANNTAVKEAENFFDKNFELEQDNYTATLCLYSNNDIVSTKNFTFTLHESHIETIKSQVEDYKYGAGIYQPVHFAKNVLLCLS